MVATEFLGYNTPVADLGKSQDATMLRIIKLGNRKKHHESKKVVTAISSLVESAAERETVPLLLDGNPLYDERGGLRLRLRKGRIS